MDGHEYEYILMASTIKFNSIKLFIDGRHEGVVKKWCQRSTHASVQDPGYCDKKIIV